MNRFVSSAELALRHAKMTRASRRARSRAVARPMPELAPVMITVLPWSLYCDGQRPHRKCCTSRHRANPVAIATPTDSWLWKNLFTFSFCCDLVQRKLVLNQASSPKKKKSSKKDEKKLKKDGKKSKKEIRKSKQKERRVAYRTLTLWSQRQIAMLKETIACHRWKAAAKILNALTYETDRTSEIIAMAGFQIFCNHSESNHELLNQFSNSMSRMDKVFHPASILKNVMVLLINDDFKTAKQIIEDESIIKKIAQINVPLNEKQKKVFSILKGYKALFKYIDWVSSGGRLGDEDNELFSQERQTRLQAQERLGLANNAIDMFEGLFQEPGNWDIFIPKYIELIEFCGMKEKAIVTLHNYCKLNPMNPNSYIFFYDFLCKHFKNQKLLLLSSLKKLKLVKPCDKRIFDLQKLLKSTDNCLELESYFNMIDHPQWRNDATAWKTFANRILHFCKKPDKSEVSKLAKKLGELWRDRSDWWPDFHFVKSEVKIKSEEHADLFLYKALVLTSLTTTGTKSRVAYSGCNF
uniref:Uncharacterized protein n=1 Tax=Strigamia maritima TaxID=126957 RepID=T1J0X9_STRMM